MVYDKITKFGAHRMALKLRGTVSHAKNWVGIEPVKTTCTAVRGPVAKTWSPDKLLQYAYCTSLKKAKFVQFVLLLRRFH